MKAVIESLKSCTVLLPTSLGHVPTIIEACTRHENVDFIFTDDDPILFAVQLVQHLDAEVVAEARAEIEEQVGVRGFCPRAREVSTGA